MLRSMAAALAAGREQQRPLSTSASAASTSGRSGYPYGRADPAAAARAPAAQPQASSSAGAASHHAPAAAPRGGAAIAAQLRSLVDALHLRSVYDTAVRRNAMTTSLALLGGVLVADLVMYGPSAAGKAKKKQRARGGNAAAAAPSASAA